jgi:hypothetical protein
VDTPPMLQQGELQATDQLAAILKVFGHTKDYAE